MSASKSCAQCGGSFYVKYPSSKRVTCSTECARLRMSAMASTRTGSSNGRWAGGKTSHPLYDTYMDMLGRCTRRTHARWESYGGRGISVCDEWASDFWKFVADMGPRPGDAKNGRHVYSIDRIDNNGNYEPKNCRWATYSEQSRNRRTMRTGDRRQNKPWTHCAKGHEFTPENTGGTTRRTKYCKTCRQAYKKMRREAA